MNDGTKNDTKKQNLILMIEKNGDNMHLTKGMMNKYMPEK